MDKKIFSIPNIVSFCRLLLIIPLILLFNHINDGYNFRMYILGLLGIIVISDTLDGFLARKLNQVTEFGKILDPVSDKLIIAVIAINMFINNQIPASYFGLVLCRDVFILIGSWLVAKKIDMVLPSSYSGKISVILTGMFMTWSIIDTSKTSSFYYSLYYLSILFIFISVLAYTRRGLNALKATEIKTIRLESDEKVTKINNKLKV